MNVKRVSKTTIALLLIVACLASALAAIMVQKSITNHMTLNADYTIALYEHGTTTPVASIEWNAFNESETKTYTIDLLYSGNVEGRIYWDAPMPSGWTFTVQEKNWDATSYSVWLSGEGHQITGLEHGHLKNVLLTLTETTAIVGQEYSFDMNFYSLG